MKLRNRWIIYLVAVLGAWIIRGWMATMRYRFRFHGQVLDPNHKAIQGRFIYAFWHDSMLLLAAKKWQARVYVLISQHADGELIAQICQRLGFRTVRGSSTRGGVEAVRNMLRRGRDSHLAVTPDGPRGPRRRVQPGVIYLASRTGLPIVPVGIGFERAWHARSWDRFAVPWPWSTGTVVTGPVVRVPPEVDKEELEQYRQLVEQRLLAATTEAENWAEGRSQESGVRSQGSGDRSERRVDIPIPLSAATTEVSERGTISSDEAA